MSTTADPTVVPESLDRVIIRFAGDSGDGMQLTGDRFTECQRRVRQRPGDAAGLPGRDPGPGGHHGRRLAPSRSTSPTTTSPPRATRPNVLVAMNPAALRSRALEARAGRHGHRQRRRLRRAQPGQGRLRRPTRSDGDLKGYNVYEVPMTSLTKQACEPLGREAPRRRALEELLRPRPHLVDVHPPRAGHHRLDRREVRLASRPVRDANLAAFQAGHAFGETAELFDHPYKVQPARSRAGHLHATSPATPPPPGASSPPAQLAKLPLFLGSYPITPASDILHELSKHKNFGVRTMQAEDEIAGIGAAIGAAFAGHLGGHHHQRARASALKSETIGLAISLELPLVIIDVQRGGPVHRAAHQDRAGRPAAGHVRPPRRVAAADRVARRPRRTASTPPSRPPASR